MVYVTTDELYFSATRFGKGARVAGEFYLGPRSGPENELQRQIHQAIESGAIVPDPDAKPKRRTRAKSKAPAEPAADPDAKPKRRTRADVDTAEPPTE